MKTENIKLKNIGAGWLYFYVHFVTEVICFFSLTRLEGNSVEMWLFPFVYDALAFVPQSLIGRFSDRFPKFCLGSAGLIVLAFAGICFRLGNPLGKYTSLIILCLGNTMTHVNGAEVTLRSSGGKLSHSAIFVGGGSFGVITGKLLAKTAIPFWPVILLALTGVPFAMLAEFYRKDADKSFRVPCEGFNYTRPEVSAGAVIAVSTLIVIVRGYMGYGIPTSWNKTTVQTAALFITMGIGKALGGVLADLFGVRRIALISSCAALPFLLFGDRYMFVSLFGVMLFSMTMSITLALLVSALKNSPGLAFGFTTIGLFLGTAPIFFFKFTTVFSNCVVITALTALCVIGFLYIVRKDGGSDEQLPDAC